MAYPYLLKPLEDDLDEYLDQVELAFVGGTMSSKMYYVSIGKALAYVECRFSGGLIDQETARELITTIEDDFLV